MTIHDTLADALRPVIPLAGRAPMDTRADTYIQWTDVYARPWCAANAWQRVTHTLQIDLYSRAPVDRLLPMVLHALRRAGVRISGWRELYESDTRYRHVAITALIDTAPGGDEEEEDIHE